MKEILLSLPAPIGAPLELVKFHWQGKAGGDSVAIASGLHGDHLNGVFVCQRLVRFMDQVAGGHNPDYELAGRVDILPVVNLYALAAAERSWPFDNLDMDLAFPGNSEGEVTERIAAAVLHHTSDSTYGLLLKSASPHYEDAAHVQCFHPDRWERKLAAHLNLGLVREIAPPPSFRLQLFYQWITADLTCFQILAGRLGTVDQALCDRLFNGIVAFMVKAGVLNYAGGAGEASETAFYKSRDEVALCSPQAGWFVADVRAGEHLEEGARLGEVRDLSSGETLGEIRTPKDGVVVTLRCNPVIFEGEPVAILLANRPRGIWPF